LVQPLGELWLIRTKRKKTPGTRLRTVNTSEANR
jgi:hypothetical protein